MMKTILTALFFVLLSSTVQAQSYSFSVNKETYRELQNDYLITNDTLAPYGLLILGRDYRAFGHDLGDTLKIGVNGWVTTTSDYYSFALDPLIGNYHFPDTNSRISYTELANPGNSILKIQWKNVGTDGDPSERLNFQLWVYEKDQKVEFHFGSGSSNNTFFSGIFRFKTDFSQTLEKVDLSGNPSAPGVNMAGNGILYRSPDDSTVYRFTYLRAGLETPHVNALSIYPNPGTGRFQVDATCVKEVKAYSSLGKEVKIVSQNGTYEIENVGAGIYLLHFSMDDGSFAQSRLVVH